MTEIVLLLLQTPSASDDLFDEPSSLLHSLHSFYSKIEFAYRMGLISSNLCHDLHIIRRIRNDFAHDIENCNFSNTRVCNRVRELARSSKKH